MLIFDLDNQDFSKCTNYFNKLVEKGTEGIVIKPEYTIKGKIPFMKVRNENYLTIIYGYDYKLNYHKFIKTKNITHKVKDSIEDFNMGLKMLQSTHLSPNYISTISHFNQNKHHDPRL